MSEDSQVTFGEVRFPVSTTVLMGTKEEPLVVERIWPGGRSEKVRVINPERSSQIPTFIFWDETVTSEQVGVIHEAFDELLSATGLEGSRFYYYGNWRDEGYKDASGKLVRFRSIEWQLNSQWNKERHQIDVSAVSYFMSEDPYQITNPHWEAIFTNKDLYTPNTNFVIGCARGDLGVIISLSRLEAISDIGLRAETQKTEIFHEFGHVLNLPSNRRGVQRLEDSLGLHCKFPGCSMKQGLIVPQDWISFTQERLRAGGHPYCQECLTDLKFKFKGQE